VPLRAPRGPDPLLCPSSNHGHDHHGHDHPNVEAGFDHLGQDDFGHDHPNVEAGFDHLGQDDFGHPSESARGRRATELPATRRPVTVAPPGHAALLLLPL